MLTQYISWGLRRINPLSRMKLAHRMRSSCCFVAALMVATILVLYTLRHYCILDKLFLLPVELIPHYSRSNIARHKATDCNLDSGVDFHKKFLYMIMTESCVPEDLLSIDIFGNSLDCQCDLLVLGYKERCTTSSTYSSHVTHIFHPSTTWTRLLAEGCYTIPQCKEIRSTCITFSWMMMLK